ncbi:MAG: response regulator [Clostridia bacterium]|nr:response regulator [Clostridia bacterium]
MYKLLICDDENYVLENLKENIEWGKYGIEVKATAVNGQMGLQKFQLSSFDILLLDIKMPVMSGVEMAKRVREFDKRVQIIFLTSIEEFEYAKAAIDVDACGYILKPFRKEDLLATMQKAVSRLSGSAPAEADTDEESREELVYIVEQVNKYIRENLSKKMSIKRIAEHFGYSTNYLGKLYKNYTGISMHDYVLKMKMERAAEMLRVPQNQISDIAYVLGYTDYAYFIKQFKEYYGETPKVFRDNCFKKK